MKFYEVQIAGRSYHSKKPLTYSTERTLNHGTLVSVPVRGKKLPGYVLDEVEKPSFTTKQIDRIDDGPPLSDKAISLYEWMEDYYPSSSGTNLQLFMPNAILKRNSRVSTEQVIDIGRGYDELKPNLRASQKKVLKQIEESDMQSVLLHGETGSGKTRVYAELAINALSRDKSALILTAEIGLTTQLANNLKKLTGKSVIVLHSQLTPKEKRQNWKSIGELNASVIVVATRSGLFAPFHSLGLIVVDEAHEDAYKQDQSPHYHAVRVAAQLAKLHSAKLVLGSATPNVSDYKMFNQMELPVLTMESPTDKTDLTSEIVDIKDRSNFSVSPHLSTTLIKRTRTALEQNEQALIFLNRRGTARLVLCQSCGWEHICPSCDISLTFHADNHKMRCHTCGRNFPPPSICPTCKSSDIFYKQIGTKSLISHVEKLFPEATVARFDTDLEKDQRLETRYEQVRSGEIDILVGTQLLSKGLDLPKLSVVGVVQADSSLAIPDFSAREKTYQQLHQIIGRVARGHRKGHVVIQTYNPNATLLKAALQKDYESFLSEELQERKEFLYPPFCHLLKISIAKPQSNSAETAAQEIVNLIQRLDIQAQILGPSPSFKFKSNGKYNWQIVVKSKKRNHLLKVIDALPKTVKYDIDPINLL